MNCWPECEQPFVEIILTNSRRLRSLMSAISTSTFPVGGWKCDIKKYVLLRKSSMFSYTSRGTQTESSPTALSSRQFGDRTAWSRRNTYVCASDIYERNSRGMRPSRDTLSRNLGLDTGFSPASELDRITFNLVPVLFILMRLNRSLLQTLYEPFIRNLRGFVYPIIRPISKRHIARDRAGRL